MHYFNPQAMKVLFFLSNTTDTFFLKKLTKFFFEFQSQRCHYQVPKYVCSVVEVGKHNLANTVDIYIHLSILKVDY